MNRGAVAGVVADVRSGSLADIWPEELDVRFTPRKRTLTKRVGKSAL
jgi:hypothetical protein